MFIIFPLLIATFQPIDSILSDHRSLQSEVDIFKTIQVVQPDLVMLEFGPDARGSVSMLDAKEVKK